MEKPRNQGLIEISGLQKLARALDKLPIELRKAAERSALRDAGKPIRDAARANASSSRDQGALQDSIGLTVRKNRSGKLRGHLTCRIGAMRGKGRDVVRIKKFKQPDGSFKIYYRAEFANPANYSHLVEYGTRHSQAKPFLRPAIISTKEQVKNNLAKGFNRGLKRAVKRAKS